MKMNGLKNITQFKELNSSNLYYIIVQFFQVELLYSIHI